MIINSSWISQQKTFSVFKTYFLIYQNAFLIAARRWNVDIMRCLLNSGKFDVNSADDKKVTALHHAASSKNIEVFSFLYQIDNINKSVKDDHGVFK